MCLEACLLIFSHTLSSVCTGVGILQNLWVFNILKPGLELWKIRIGHRTALKIGIFVKNRKHIEKNMHELQRSFSDH